MVDVLVAGGGAAGLSAAIAAARRGMQVVLIEKTGALGGAIAPGDAPVAHPRAKRLVWGIFAELADAGLESHELTGALERLARQAGVEIRLNTAVVSACSNTHGHFSGKWVDSVTLSGPDGQQALSARVFIDATGEGALCRQAGANCLPSGAVHGDFTLDEGHLARHTRFPDAICYLCDTPTPYIWEGDYYTVPYRAFVAAGFANLLCPGRHLSARGKAAQRMSAFAPCVMTGQAAGTLAAAAIPVDYAPAIVEQYAIRGELMLDGALPAVAYKPITQ
nr:FAD-dependent oxidoreductase [bacterium]